MRRSSTKVHSKIPVLLLLNKIDNSNQEQLEKQVAFGRRKCLMQRYIRLAEL
jgi:GTPase Era involved in 16S rRNA processing